MTTAVDIRDVTKIYSPDSSQAVTALENISLTINDNEFFTLLGPSGCGKTTLLRLIAGFEQVSGGEIMLFDKEIENLEPNRRSVNTVFQHYALFPHMSVFENVAFPLKLRKIATKEKHEKVMDALKTVQLSGFAERQIDQLSGGQKQRIAIARAILANRPILLLDEATSALDAASELAVKQALEALMENKTTLIIAHRLSTVVNADMIVVLDEGKIISQGTHTELLDSCEVYQELATIQLLD